MTKKLLIFLLIMLAIIISGCINKTEIIEETSYPNTNQSNYSLNFVELKESNYTSGNFNVEGYVVKIYTCPPCQKGDICKPCMRNNIVISENNKVQDSYSLSSSELILFTDNPKQFELTKKYKFSIKITDYKSTGEPINDIDLLGYDLID